MNDGIIGTSILTTQLFVTPNATSGLAISPSIFFTLSYLYTLNTIDLFGGDLLSNGIPGAITGVTVTFIKADFTSISQTFTTTAFGVVGGGGVPVNDRVTLTGSTLDGVGAYTVILSNFQGTVSNWFSLTEVELNGSLAPPSSAVPEPSSLALAGLGSLSGLGVWLRRRRRAVA